MKLLGASFLTLPLLFSLTLLAQSQSEAEKIKSKEKELEKLRREIDDFEERIRKSERREKSTLETLDDNERQSLLIRRLLRKLKDESSRAQNEIQDTKWNVSKLENQLDDLRNNYATYVSSVYKYGRLYDMELLLTSKSINQLAIRIEYLRRFSNQRKKDLTSIARNKSLLEEQSRSLNSKLSAQERLIAQKAAEDRRIKKKTAERQKLLASIRKSKDIYKKELQRKTKAAADLENIIADLIERERIRKKREAALAKKEKRSPLESSSPESGFSSRRAKLRWPVLGGSVVARFGNQIHPVLKTVTQNTGIDISVPIGTDVRTVSEGEVATISWLPSYGNLVIVNHNNGFRTVYTHLSEIMVTQGQKVSEGELIGKSGESLSGPGLHFELWKDRDKQDPELWLSRR